MDVKTIYLIRHGETESNRKGIFRGRLDVPLSQVGIDQAYGLESFFREISLDTIFSSPLSRAIKTARIAFPQKNPRIEHLLDNIDLGDWSGKEKHLVKEKFPREWEKWMKSPEKMEFPGGGETLSHVYARAVKFLELAVLDPGLKVAAVTHRSVAKVILAAAMGLETEYFWKFHLDNASISIICHSPERGFTLTKLNDTNHLDSTVMEWY